VEQQIHRQLGDGYDSIVNYACGNETKFLCSDYLAFKKFTRIVHKT
jgi:hypothetical protein